MSFRGPEGNTRREPITTALRIRPGALVASASGYGWAFDTDRTAVAEATLVAGTVGGAAADDALPSGGAVYRAGSRTIGRV